MTKLSNQNFQWANFINSQITGVSELTPKDANHATAMRGPILLNVTFTRVNADAAPTLRVGTATSWCHNISSRYLIGSFMKPNLREGLV